MVKSSPASRGSRRGQTGPAGSAHSKGGSRASARQPGRPFPHARPHVSASPDVGDPACVGVSPPLAVLAAGGGSSRGFPASSAHCAQTPSSQAPVQQDPTWGPPGGPPPSPAPAATCKCRRLCRGAAQSCGPAASQSLTKSRLITPTPRGGRCGDPHCSGRCPHAQAHPWQLGLPAPGCLEREEAPESAGAEVQTEL